MTYEIQVDKLINNYSFEIDFERLNAKVFDDKNVYVETVSVKKY